MIIKELKKEGLPREKAIREGISSCNDVELLAIILRSGCVGKNVLELASEIMAIYKDFPTLSNLPIEQFCSLKGISETKAITLCAVFEIARRSSVQAPYLKLLSPKEIYEHYRLSFAHKNKEFLLLICYDKRKRIRKEKVIFEGDENQVSASMKNILSEISNLSFPFFVLLHNHPSGVPLPSNGEVEFTHKLQEKSILLGNKLLDHIILGNETYFSFKENDLLD